MASLLRVTSLKPGLLAKTGPALSIPAHGAASLSGRHDEFKFDAQQTKNDELLMSERNIPATYDKSQKCEESQPVQILENVRQVTVDGASSNDINIDPAPYHPTPNPVTLRVGKRVPGRSLLSFLKPNLNIQSSLYSTDSSSVCSPNDCDKLVDCDAGKAPDCKPKSLSLDLPLPCLKLDKPPKKCVVPVQKKWTSCERSMCLPCCCCVHKPCKCVSVTVGINTCPRKTYRIAAYSECAKKYGRKHYKKECCYHRVVCYARHIAEREIKPLLHIKDRQALVLGFRVKGSEGA